MILSTGIPLTVRKKEEKRGVRFSKERGFSIKKRIKRGALFWLLKCEQMLMRG
jgi:hypothetical protein